MSRSGASASMTQPSAQPQQRASSFKISPSCSCPSFASQQRFTMLTTPLQNTNLTIHRHDRSREHTRSRNGPSLHIRRFRNHRQRPRKGRRKAEKSILHDGVLPRNHGKANRGYEVSLSPITIRTMRTDEHQDILPSLEHS